MVVPMSLCASEISMTFNPTSNSILSSVKSGDWSRPVILNFSTTDVSDRVTHHCWYRPVRLWVACLASTYWMPVV